MGHRTDMLQSINGNIPARLPYAPRFDLWFNAHQHRGTLPEEYRDCRVPLDISRRLGVGAHLIVPDYLRPECQEQMYDRGIGVYHLPQVPYRVSMRGVERKVEEDGGVTSVTYRTPKGTVSVEYEFTTDMRNAGTSISWMRKHAIASEDDYAPVAWLFEHMDVEPEYGGLEKLIGDAGEDGLVVANGCMPGSPVQYVMRDLMEMNYLYMQMFDNPEGMRALSDAIGGYFERLMPVSAACPAEAILFGANMDETITYPPFYEEHIMPWIRRFADLAHAAGKKVLIHADGENRALFDLYRQSGIDILEAVAPAPMTKTDIHEILERSGGMTVWGGIPSVILMPDTFPETEFERYMEGVLKAVGKRSRFILGISDTTPPDADFSRLARIRDMLV